MTTKRNNLKRGLSLLLAFALCFGLLSVCALADNEEISGDGGKTPTTVSLDLSEENQKASVTDPLTAEELQQQLLSEYEGWDVVDENGAVIGTVGADGTVTNANGETVELALTKNEDGTYSYSATMQKDSSDTDGIKLTGDDVDTSHSEEHGTVTGTVENEDGSVSVTYVRTDGSTTTTTVVTTTPTGTRTTTTHTATVAQNGGTTVTGELEGTSSGESDGDFTVNILGPSDELLENVQKNAESRIRTPQTDTGRLYWVESGADPETDTEEPLTLTGNSLQSAVIAGSIYYYWFENGNKVTTEDLSKAYRYVNRGYTVYQSAQSAGFVELEDENGNTYYAYCADEETSTNSEAGYNIVNVVDSSKLDDKSAAHVTYAVANGYWGEENTAEDGEEASIGSLDYVRELAAKYAKENGLEIDATQIDDALAMTATQAAIWAYTNPNAAFNSTGKTVTELAEDDALFLHVVKARKASGGTYEESSNVITDKQKAAATALFWALYNKNLDTSTYEDTSTDIITEEDIQSVTISDVQKVELTSETNDEKAAELAGMIQQSLLDTLNPEDAAKTAAEALMDMQDWSEKLYTTDVTLTLAVVKERVNGTEDGLSLYVFAGSTLVATKAITENDGVASADGSSTSYTIEDVVLPTGQTITVNLYGTQDIAEGAYLYQSTVGVDSENTETEYEEKTRVKHNADGSKTVTTESVKKTTTVKETSQTLTGLIVAGGTRGVNVNVSFNFDVNETKPTIEMSETSEEAILTAVSVATETTTQPTPTPDPDPDPTDIPDEDTPTTDIPDEDTPTTDIPEEDTPTTDIPDEDTPTTDIPEEDTPTTDIPEEETLTTDIPDEDVPLSDVPVTGDDLPVWILLAVISGIGLALGSLAGRKGKNEL